MDIISLILMILKGARVKLLGEIRSQSLLGERGLRQSSINGSSLLTFVDSLISSTYLPYAVKSNKRPSYFCCNGKIQGLWVNKREHFYNINKQNWLA